MSVFFPNFYFFRGAVQSLESLRTGQAGVLLLGLFVTQGDIPLEDTQSILNQLTILQDIAAVTIGTIPPTLGFTALPYYDYNLALL
jgi:hypothetical protein